MRVRQLPDVGDGAVEPAGADHDVGAGVHAVPGRVQRGEVGGAVGVHERDQVGVAREQPGADRGTLAAARAVHDPDRHRGRGRGERDLGGAVGAAVVDDEYLDRAEHRARRAVTKRRSARNVRGSRSSSLYAGMTM